MVDMKSQKEIDISECIDKYDNTYSGCNKTMLWLGEEAFLLCHANGDIYSADTVWYCEVVELKDVLK